MDLRSLRQKLYNITCNTHVTCNRIPTCSRNSIAVAKTLLIYVSLLSLCVSHRYKSKKSTREIKLIELINFRKHFLVCTYILLLQEFHIE